MSSCAPTDKAFQTIEAHALNDALYGCKRTLLRPTAAYTQPLRGSTPEHADRAASAATDLAFSAVVNGGGFILGAKASLKFGLYSCTLLLAKKLEHEARCASCERLPARC
jgi:hypothetical protein